MKKAKRVLLIIMLLFSKFFAFSQIHQVDTMIFSALDKTKLQFFLDDTYVFGGYNTAGVYYSNHFRDLEYRPGFVFGVEQYVPLSGKIFLSTGINVSKRSFSFSAGAQDVQINNLYIDLPVSAAFELPVLRSMDFRLLIGANFGIRTDSSIRDNYNTVMDDAPDLFVYDINDFHSVDFGWTFGLSSEYKNVIVRFRTYSGLVKLDHKDQGMMSSLNFEIGYFLFRTINNK